MHGWSRVPVAVAVLAAVGLLVHAEGDGSGAGLSAVDHPADTGRSDGLDRARSYLGTLFVEELGEESSGYKRSASIKEHGDRLKIEISDKSKTERKGVFRVSWERKRVAELELLKVASDLCPDTDSGKGGDCYIVLRADGYEELKAPVGQWLIASAEMPDIFRLPTVGDILRSDPWDATGSVTQ